MNEEYIIWDGNNTKEVIGFCISWCYDLCAIHKVFTHPTTGIKTLCIEPADTMRGSSIYIPINKKIKRVIRNGFYHSIEIEK